MEAKWGVWERLTGPRGYEWQMIIYERKYHKELEGGVVRITMNRPPMNLLNTTMLREMSVAYEQASRDRTVGVVLLTGAGDVAFCAGGDVAWEEQELGTLGTGGGGGFGSERVRQPVIAVVKGWCVGGGNHIAYRCDLTIAADDARFAQNGPRVGSPADGYLVAYLISAVGQKKAREIWMLCRRYIAQEALEMGLINAVVPLARLDEEVDQWCEEILSLSPGCVEILKASFEMYLDHIKGHTGFDIQQKLYPHWFEGAEIREAQRAFMEKRVPYFWKIS